MNTLTWRLLTAEELTRVYLNEMRRDFPPTELKPLSMVLNSEAVGDSHTWGVYDGETLVAYLLMVRPRGATVSQLDYFAVLPACRAAGLGAKLLAALPGKEAGADAILIEAELPEKADAPAMAVRRLGFYARCGAVDTGWTEKLFGASWFRVLTLAAPGQQPMGAEDACRALADCYRRVIGEPKWGSTSSFTARTEPPPSCSEQNTKQNRRPVWSAAAPAGAAVFDAVSPLKFGPKKGRLTPRPKVVT